MPFSGFESFDECVSTMMDDEGHDKESAENICGALQAEEKSENGNPDELMAALEQGSGLIADVGVDLVSGVDVPAVNSKWVMMKSGGARRGHDYRVNTPVLLAKEEQSDKRISYAAAMIPREPDKEGDVAPTPTVEKAAHDFLKQDGGIDTDHSLIDGEGTPVESWVLKESREFDLPDGGTETYGAGTWMLGIEWGAEAWERIKAGELTGLSIYGMAEHVPLERAASCQLSATKSSTPDNGKGQEPESGDMASDTDGDNPDGGDGGGGVTLGEVHSSVTDMADTIDTLKEAVETEKQDEQEAAAMLGDAYGMDPGQVMDVLNAAADGDADALMDVMESMGMEMAETGEDKDDEMEASEGESGGGGESVEKRTEDAHLEKGHDGEGVRETEAAKNTEASGGSAGMPSYRAAAAERDTEEI